MKNKVLYIALSLISILNLTSCKNDLEVLAPGEEAVSVYGVLNPNESVQNIRINKVYLTDGDILAAGQDASQINYGPGELLVTLTRFNAGSTTPTLTTDGNPTKKEIVLTETVVTTESGTFNTNQRIWQTTDKLFNSGEYKLTIKNVATDKEFTAQNIVLDSVKQNNNMPFKYHPTLFPTHGNYNLVIYPSQVNALVTYTTLTVNQKIKFNSIPNAKLYNVVMRFHYIDTLSSSPNIGIPNYVDYNFSTAKSSTLEGGEPMEVSFLIDDFYINLGSEMSKKTSASIKSRRSYYMEFIIRAGAESLNTFLQVNQPSNTIAQDKPNYSNIKGGVGIFSSSSRSIITHDLSNDFINKIACHPKTNPYLFCNSVGVKTTVCQ